MNNFERITASPEALGDFLGALPILSGPWDDDFHRVFCDSCDAENCDAENCTHQAERDSPTWWLKRAYTGSGPVKTDSTNPYKRQAADLRLEAMHQRDRFGRNLLATELEEAAATIEALVEKLGGERMKILIGGSPCTHWSIAQTKNRETEASGIGWELFLNYRIARDKYQPDFFLYENNKSMSPAIRAQITAELGVEPVLINSALVSAQNRQRLYWVGRRNPDGTYSQVAVEQPVDRGILLRDILESGVCWKEKGYALLSTTGGTTADDMVSRHQRNGAAEPVAIKPLTEKEMDYMVRETKDGRNHFDFDYFHDATQEKSACVTANTHKGVPYNVLVEPVRIGTIENDAKNQTFDSQQYRVYSPDAKSVTLCGNGGGLGAKTGLYAVPVAGRVVGRRINEQGHRDDYNEEIERIQRFEVNEDPNKTNCLSTVEKDNMIAVPVRVGAMPNKDGELGTSQSRRIYSTDGKSVSLQARPNGGGADGAATGLYAVPVIPDGKGQFVIKAAGGKEIPVYEVRGGRITIKGKTYPIKLADGFYIIRKLTVTECKRLQTVPDTYAFPVSDTQAYKMLGNGWTVDVIAHIMSHFTGLTEEAVEVLSMYDGMSCGHIALDKLGAEITAYYATEIDKYAVQTTQHNFPDTVQLGDAFQVRAEDWRLPEPVGMEAPANG